MRGENQPESFPLHFCLYEDFQKQNSGLCEIFIYGQNPYFLQ